MLQCTGDYIYFCIVFNSNVLKFKAYIISVIIVYRMVIMKKIVQKDISNLLFMIVGTLFIALGITVFYKPYELVAGGMGGISIILYHKFAISPDTTLFISVFPLLLLSYFLLGKKYTLNTIFCSILLPVFVRLVKYIPEFEGDMILASIFGGALSGLGIGLVFKGGSSTGGTAIIQQILHDYLRIPLSISVMLIDGLVLLGAFIFFDFSTGLYSIISLVIVGKMVDITQSGGMSAKTAIIISDKTNELIAELTGPLYLGVTVLDGKGAYTGNRKEVLLCTFPDKTIVAVKNSIYNIDPRAFCIIVDAKEVLGNRWQSYLVK